MKHLLQRYVIVLPILYLFFAVFVGRTDVLYVYIAASILVILTLLAQRQHKLKPELLLAQWLVTLAAIGLSAAFILSIEKIELLKDPSHIASCSLNPVVACSPVIASDQASVFGFPNSFIGILGFAAVLAAGMTIAGGASRLSKIWWRTLLGGITFGAVFCIWLFYEGVFVIGKLCLYCMLVWLVTFALLWLTTAFMIERKHINLGKRFNTLLLYKYELIASTYAVIFMILLYRWSDYWFSLF